MCSSNLSTLGKEKLESICSGFVSLLQTIGQTTSISDSSLMTEAGIKKRVDNVLAKETLLLGLWQLVDARALAAIDLRPEKPTLQLLAVLHRLLLTYRLLTSFFLLTNLEESLKC